MSEAVASGANIFIMVCLIGFAGYLSSVLGEQRIGLAKRLIHCIITFSFKPILDIKKSKRVFLLCYIVIPALLVNVLGLARQLNIGKMYIRADIGFIAGAILWITLPLLFIGLINRVRKEELKNK